MNDNLVKMAKEALANAYAPYSKFKVGAAILTASGKIYTGVNIENASYGATVCAERVAIFKAVSDGEREIVEIAVASNAENPAAPCGICRQVMAEFALNAKIYIAGRKGKVVETTVKEILPFAFTAKDLNER